MSKSPSTSSSDTAPPAPAFCTRTTPENARRASDELTRRELSKLNEPQPTSWKMGSVTTQTARAPAGALGAVLLPPSGGDAARTEASLHSMLLQYAEKYSACCDQLCTLSALSRDTHSTILKMKDTQHETQSMKEHYQGVAEQYEEENGALVAKLKTVEVQAHEAHEVHLAHEAHLAHLARDSYGSNLSIPIFLLFVVYTLFLLEMERLYNLNSYYTEYRGIL